MDRILWSRILVILGLFGMLVGALDPLEGSIIILPCAGLAALGVGIGQVRRRRLLYLGFTLIAVGVAALFLLSAAGGVGGPGGTSLWWALIVIPYPVGWIVGLAGAILGLLESFRQSPAAA